MWAGIPLWLHWGEHQDEADFRESLVSVRMLSWDKQTQAGAGVSHLEKIPIKSGYSPFPAVGHRENKGKINPGTSSSRKVLFPALL